LEDLDGGKLPVDVHNSQSIVRYRHDRLGETSGSEPAGTMLGA
jgi:hypothetical protein